MQITVAEPSVSTELKCRIRTLRRARRWAARTSDKVSVGNSPSGTMATMIPIEKIRSRHKGMPITAPTAKKPMPMAIANAAIMWLRRASSRRIGVMPAVLVWVRWAILPNSVSAPVANTRPRPVPETTDEPASTTFVACDSGTSSHGSDTRALGSDSPVIAASLILEPTAPMSLKSAGALSPASSKMISPTTRRSAEIKKNLSALKTFTSCGRSLASAAIVCSLRYSCQKENRPLTRMITTIAQPTRAMPSPGLASSATKASAAAIQRMIEKNWKNSPSSRNDQLARLSCSIRFGPNSRSLLSASSGLSP